MPFVELFKTLFIQTSLLHAFLCLPQSTTNGSYTHTHTHTQIHTHTHTHSHTYRHTNTHTLAHTYIQTHSHTHTHTYTHSHIHKHSHTHTYTHTYTHTTNGSYHVVNTCLTTIDAQSKVHYSMRLKNQYNRGPATPFYMI